MFLSSFVFNKLNFILLPSTYQYSSVLRRDRTSNIYSLFRYLFPISSRLSIFHWKQFWYNNHTFRSKPKQCKCVKKIFVKMVFYYLIVLILSICNKPVMSSWGKQYTNEENFFSQTHRVYFHITFLREHSKKHEVHSFRLSF